MYSIHGVLLLHRRLQATGVKNRLHPLQHTDFLRSLYLNKVVSKAIDETKCPRVQDDDFQRIGDQHLSHEVPLERMLGSGDVEIQIAVGGRVRQFLLSALLEKAER